MLGLRRYGIRKFVYAGAGLTTMAAFCYPHEAIEFSKIGWAHAQRTWEDFQACELFLMHFAINVHLVLAPEPTKKK